MDIILTGIFIFAVLIIIFAFINLKLSIALYIAYMILVPYLQFNIAGFSLSYNLVNTLLLVVFIYRFQVEQKVKLSYEIIIPLLFLYLSLLFISFFTWGMPWGIQFNLWRASFMQTCFIAFIIWNLSLVDQKSLIYIKWAFIISITIAGIYGLFLTQMNGINPYTSFLSSYFGGKDVAEIYGTTNETRLDFSKAGKIQATMNHPMLWTLILCFSSIVFSILYIKKKKIILWPLLALVGFNILISGVRTGIAAITIGFVYFLIRYHNLKLIVLTIVLLIAATKIVQTNDDLSNLFSSFIDVSGQKSSIRGSSINMRLEQLHGLGNEIKEHELVGKGYGWTDYYEFLYGDHPILLAFESLIFIVVCNSGIIGSLIWIIFFFLLFRIQRKILVNRIDILLMDTFIIIFISYTIGTGEYGYLPFFAIYYTFLLAYLNSIE